MMTISEVGEKRLIAEIIRPLFNPENSLDGPGDDCALVAEPNGDVLLLTTDRVPADLIAYRLGILDAAGIGAYLARLNLSDIAACGGTAFGILLNLGLPNDFLLDDFRRLCHGFGAVAKRHGCRVLGGDITSASELSISATAVGRATAHEVLTRRGAKEGDTIFVSRPVGVTPAAFAYLLAEPSQQFPLEREELSQLTAQFTDLEPMLELGRLLASSGYCTSCMDNTDGVGNSMLELSEASGVAIVIESDRVVRPTLVDKIANGFGIDALELCLGPGADFSLVGTLTGRWDSIAAAERFGASVTPVGYTTAGTGVYIEDKLGRRPLRVHAWNYFHSSPNDPYSPKQR